MESPPRLPIQKNKKMIKEIIEKLASEQSADREELILLLNDKSEDNLELLRVKAQARARERFGNKIFVRGLIEFSNICKNDCFYCGLRRSNGRVARYRLTKEQILGCCENGYALGFRTFVLQSGEDGCYTDEVITDIVSEVKKRFPDCAVTLSLGERSRESYLRLFEAGADRYLLRHETASKPHYERLHPGDMSFENRLSCLRALKEIGFQTGAGFMVGSPFQTTDDLADDLLFLKAFEPQMCGIGPFIPHRDTPFGNYPQGSLDLTLKLLSIVRLLLPDVLLPSTTALGTIDPRGRELGILHGANVVMPNLSPKEHRKDYSLYDNKICTGDEAAECVNCLALRMKSIGYETVTDRGDFKQHKTTGNKE